VPLIGVLPISLTMLGQHVPALPPTKRDHTTHADQDKTIQAWHFAIKFASTLLLIQIIADRAVVQPVPIRPVAAEALPCSPPTQKTVGLVEKKSVPASLVAVESLSLLPQIQPTVVHVVQHAQRITHAAPASARQRIAKGSTFRHVTQLHAQERPKGAFAWIGRVAGILVPVRG
jgi:hypothetical protein